MTDAQVRVRAQRGKGKSSALADLEFGALRGECDRGAAREAIGERIVARRQSRRRRTL
jgi:hypothetical protein